MFVSAQNFVAQFGIAADPLLTSSWNHKVIMDEPVQRPNSRGTISFACSGPHSRANQVFINLVDNKNLDAEGFAPFARVISGMDVIDALYSGYGEGGKGDGSDGRGPSQNRLVNNGNSYLRELYPKLSYVKTAEVVEERVP